ncbi:hypothetical protein STEG23_018205, partial [Scotinomys teguina]
TVTSSSPRAREDSWLKSLFVRKVDPRKDAHSNLLAKKETSSLYKLQFHNVKPECLDKYNKICQEVLPKIHEGKQYPCTLVGTWNTWYGEQDQAVHLWRYEGGYPALTEVMNKLKENQEFVNFRKARSDMLLSRKNQLLLEFSFWNEPVPRSGPNIYELRSYQLRPGTMIEWGNYWARAIRFRQDSDEAVGGFFSQIGQLYMVHHLWAYKDLQTREDIRSAAWQKHGWEELVYYTACVSGLRRRLVKASLPRCMWKAEPSNLYLVFSPPHSGNGIQNHDPAQDLTPPVKLPRAYTDFRDEYVS